MTTNLSTTVFDPTTRTYNLKASHNSLYELVYFWRPTISIFIQRLSNTKLAMFGEWRTTGTQFLRLQSCDSVETKKVSFADKEKNKSQQQLPNNLIFLSVAYIATLRMRSRFLLPAFGGHAHCKKNLELGKVQYFVIYRNRLSVATAKIDMVRAHFN